MLLTFLLRNARIAAATRSDAQWVAQHNLRLCGHRPKILRNPSQQAHGMKPMVAACSRRIYWDSTHADNRVYAPPAKKFPRVDAPAYLPGSCSQVF